jgi:8-oxo-dGTP pyrophosphatase MutT (NUDIX family)
MGPPAVTVAAVIVERYGEVLLLQRGWTAPWMPGRWNLPGGVIDAGETVEEAAAREAREEAGILVERLRYVGRAGEVAFFHAQQWRGPVKLDWESIAYAWVPVDRLDKFDTVPGLQRVLRRFARAM